MSIVTNMSSGNETENNWFGMQKQLELFSAKYRQVHAYISVVLSVLGIMGNVLNIFILTRKNMISTTNILLTALSVSDVLKLLVHLPNIVLNYYIFANQPNPLGNLRYLMFYVIVVIAFHSASIWLTVSLALFRYIAIKLPLKAATYCSQYRAKLTIFIVSLAVAGLSIPISLSYSYSCSYVNNETDWYLIMANGTDKFNFVQSFNLWTMILLIRLLPCVLLLVLSILLILELQRFAKSRSKLRGQRSFENDGNLQRQTETNRTTGMLVVVVALFIVIEMPHGILLLLLAINKNVMDQIYESLGDLIDDITLMNNGINFVIYCTMSKKFRDTFMEMFSCSIAKSKYLHRNT
ncbi:G-protein coupled receptor 139 [Biomphalaria glabrata]|nr:putative G-protein coupled receptor 139 [Biomphalaria glabrata]